MIIKHISLLILFLLSASAYACEIKFPSHLVILGESPDLIQVMKHSSCTQETLNEVNETLVGVEGKITASQFSEILKSKNQNVIFEPRLIQVQHLKHLVREQLIIPTGIQLRSSEAVNAPNFLVLNSGDKVEVQCIGCLYGSQQPLNLNVNRYDGSTRTLIVKADFKKMVKAFRIRGFHPAFAEVAASSLDEEFVESIPHTDLITNLDTLKYYKLNKPIRDGQLLRQSDLNAINLVKAGQTTEVIIENDLVKLKTHGICRSNGSLGEFVEVFHPQKKKKYNGKVIDINKVLVEI
jgi:flagella basal body P-ring formation protein FlgA